MPWRFGGCNQIASPPVFLTHCGPAQVRMSVHWTDVMPCDRPRPRWAPRAPARARRDKPLLLSAPSLSAHITGQSTSHCRRRDARDAAAHWSSDDASPKSPWFWAAETKGPFSWGHWWGMWLRFVIMAQRKGLPFPLSRLLTIYHAPIKWLDHWGQCAISGFNQAKLCLVVWLKTCWRLWECFFFFFH